MSKIFKIGLFFIISLISISCKQEKDLQPEPSISGLFYMDYSFAYRTTPGAPAVQATTSADEENTIEFKPDGTFEINKLRITVYGFSNWGDKDSGEYLLENNKLTLSINGQVFYFDVNQTATKLTLFQSKSEVLRGLEDSKNTLTKEEYEEKRNFVNGFTEYEVDNVFKKLTETI